MNDNATLVVTAVPNPAEAEAMQEYLRGVMPLLQGAGGTLVKRLKTDAVVNGRPAGMTLVMDFASAAEVKALFESEAYGALIRVRDRGFTEMNILIARSM